jgi:bifunctional DNase/RNase
VASGPIKLHVSDVQTAVPASVGVEAGMVVLTEDEQPGRSLRIIIGQPEARAIMAAWQGATPGRPSTWDLYVSTVAVLGARIDRVVLTGVQEERHYFAVIELEHQGERRTLSCRPSDAIALALRSYNATIVAESSVLDAAGVLPDGSKPAAAAAVSTAAKASIDEREAALAAREAELAARERALTQREGPGGVTEPAESMEATETADATEAADATEPTEVTGVSDGRDATGPGG